MKEEKEQFYQLIYDYYTNPDAQQVNPIDKFLGYTYRETVWPREENTGLNETRKRAEYFLNKAGFTRDGYDIQLGTQRAFWRNLQEDRKRSKNNDGGYYSSMNYLSTEETGSSFSFSEQGLSTDNKQISYDLSLFVSSSIDEGIFNSISLLEGTSSEREIATFSGSIESEYAGDKLYIDRLNSINARAFVFDTSGEFNNQYNDFYEETADGTVAYKKSVGTLYRNTSYKSLLTSLPVDRSSLSDVIAKTQDEEIFVNPKLKYVAFVGGGEMNTGSFVQNPSNFSSATGSALGFPDDVVYSVHHSGSDLYIGGLFQNIGGESFSKAAKYNRQSNEWEQLGSGPSLFNILAIASSGSDIYVGGTGSPYVQYWDGATWNSVTSPGSTVRSMTLYNGKIYVGTNSNLRRYDNPGWTTISTTSDPVYALEVHGGVLYFGGGNSLATSGFVRSWDGATVTSLGNPSARVYSLAFSGSDIFAGGDSSGAAFIKKWQSPTTWNSFAAGLSGTDVYAMQVVDDDLYVAGAIDMTGSMAKYNLTSTTWSFLGDPTYGTEVLDLALSGSDLHYGGDFVYPYNYLSSYSTEDDKSFYLNSSPFTFANNYFSESVSQSDFSFSTLDNGLVDAKSSQTDKKPFFDSYEEYVEDIRPLTKEYSTIPEFRITEHMQHYVAENNSNFRAENKSFLTLDGAGSRYRSAQQEGGQYDSEFLKTYALSDLFKSHDQIKQENSQVAQLESVELKVSGIKKLLPYNGFYPKERTVQLANIYEEYAGSNLHGGIYNLSYENENVEQFTVNTQNTSSMSSISVAKYGDRFYMATGKPDLGGTDDIYGGVYIYRSEENDLKTWSNTEVAHFSASSGFGYTEYGRRVQLVSASNGLNLFLYTSNIPLDSSEGYVLHATSSDGTNWSEPDRMQVSGSSVYISGSANSRFGFYFDALHDTVGSDEKIFLLIGAHYEDAPSTDSGEVYIVTGTLEQNEWQWSDKSSLLAGSGVSNYAGHGVSLISCSSGYQAFAAERFGDSPTTNYGNIWAITSSNGSTWSTPVIISSGSSSTEIGLNNIKAVDFDDKTYLFSSEPLLDLNGKTNNGAVYVISSSANNEWPTSTSYLTKTQLYSTDIDDDRALNYTSSYSIEANVVEGVLYYSFANYIQSSSLGTDYYPGSLVIGKTADGDNWETLEENNIFLRNIPNTEYGNVSAFRAITTLVDTSGEKDFLYTFADVHDGTTEYSKVLMVGYNSVVRFALKVSGSEKYYKHAALEPFFAPGILYNTIKSGLAVDWPCATGSNTAIVPYGGNTIVNAYYPQPFEMAYHSGSNVYESMYGHVRSNIDYRIPFENIIFPNEAFKNKDFLAEDLISKTALQTLPDSDALVQFIDQVYIYGGYEPYISPIDFGDVGSLGPKRFSVPFVYRKNNTTDTGLYTLAMSNFLAETVKFFLKDEKMVTFTSSPDNKWKQFNSNKTYYMDVVLEKSPELVMMEAYHSDLHPTGSNNEKMDGRYFGYPVNKTDKDLWAGAQFTEEERKLIHNDPAYAPYTPPYFEGEARVRISFKPSGTSRAYTVQEIFDEATIEDIFVDVAKGATTGSDAYVNKMPIGSSFDLFGAAQATEVTIDERTGEQTVRELPDTQNWVISPKMETPVLDFSGQSLESYQNDYSKTGGFGRGMWSGYGVTPPSGSGVKVRLEYPYTTISSPLTASLLEQVGFRAEEKNVGTIADNKTISEAVVLVPYLEKNDSEYSNLDNNTGFNFIKIDEEKFRYQLKNVRNGQPAIPADGAPGVDKDIESTSISRMIEKMERYVIPPEMNFLQYSDIKPFVMYIFEFEHELKQQDLVDIWQGVMPDISRNAEKDEVTIKHPSGPYEFFEGKEIPDNLRWMVFKIKRKAEANYFNVTSTTKDDARFDFNKIIGREEGTDVYSYNWPYDFFSLVEFAKVELKLDYKAKETEE